MENIQYRQIGINEKEILDEIFRLRVICRKGSEYINFKKFPNGWFDDMDFYSNHFAAFNNNELIGSGRITILNTIKEHPYYPALENIIPKYLLLPPIAYLSRDQVLETFAGRGIRRRLLNDREDLCRMLNISDLFIDVALNGNQYNNFTNDGYIEIGQFETDKIHWDLGESILMHKKLL